MIVEPHAIALAEDKFPTNELCKAQKLQSHWFCCFNLKLTPIRGDSGNQYNQVTFH